MPGWRMRTVGVFVIALITGAPAVATICEAVCAAQASPPTASTTVRHTVEHLHAAHVHTAARDDAHRCVAHAHAHVATNPSRACCASLTPLPAAIGRARANSVPAPVASPAMLVAFTAPHRIGTPLSLATGGGPPGESRTNSSALRVLRI